MSNTGSEQEYSENFQKVQGYLLDLDLDITNESVEDHTFVVDNYDNGINKMTIFVEEPIVVIEQFLFELNNPSIDMLKDILRKNREIIHGAMVLDDTATKILFRDTLQLENLDHNELEASINSLSMLLSEYTDHIIQFAKV